MHITVGSGKKCLCVWGRVIPESQAVIQGPRKPSIRSFTFSLLKKLCASYYDLMLLFIEHNFLGIRPQAVTSSTINSSTKASHGKAVTQINTFRHQWLIIHYHVTALNKLSSIPHDASRMIILPYPNLSAMIGRAMTRLTHIIANDVDRPLSAFSRGTALWS